MGTSRTSKRLALAGLGAWLLMSCAGEPTEEHQRSSGVSGTVTLTIEGGVITPNSVRVAPGGSLTIVNNDSVLHEMMSTPHPTHTDCPSLNVGELQPGESRTVNVGTAEATCGLHDHYDAGNTNLRATVVVGPNGGGGGMGGGGSTGGGSYGEP